MLHTHFNPETTPATERLAEGVLSLTESLGFLTYPLVGILGILFVLMVGFMVYFVRDFIKTDRKIKKFQREFQKDSGGLNRRLLKGPFGS